MHVLFSLSSCWVMDDDDDDDDDDDVIGVRFRVFQVMKSHEGRNRSELTVVKGDILEVCRCISSSTVHTFYFTVTF